MALASRSILCVSILACTSTNILVDVSTSSNLGLQPQKIFENHMKKNKNPRKPWWFEPSVDLLNADSSSPRELQEISALCATRSAFAAWKRSGEVLCWGDCGAVKAGGVRRDGGLSRE